MFLAGLGNAESPLLIAAGLLTALIFCTMMHFAYYPTQTMRQDIYSVFPTRNSMWWHAARTWRGLKGLLFLVEAAIAGGVLGYVISSYYLVPNKMGFALVGVSIGTLIGTWMHLGRIPNRNDG